MMVNIMIININQNRTPPFLPNTPVVISCNIRNIRIAITKSIITIKIRNNIMIFNIIMII